MAHFSPLVSSNPLAVFSERYEFYSVCVKQLFFLKLGAQYKAIDLDHESDAIQTKKKNEGDAIEMHAALANWTGKMVLPSVFIGGKYIGDCRKTWDLHKEGKLVPLLTEAHVSCPLAQVHAKSAEDELSQPTVA